jgi:hypothetical protein
MTFKRRHFGELTADVPIGEPNLTQRVTSDMREAAGAVHLLLLNAPSVFLVDDEGSQLVPHVDPVALYLNLPRAA